MRAERRAIGIAVGAVACVAMVWYSGVIEGYEKRYEIRPEIRLPEHRTDAARAIDAYERLMGRYMTLSERNFASVSGNLQGVTKRLDSIDGKLTGLLVRIGRIEKALGIEPPKVEVPKGSAPSEDKLPGEGGREMPVERGKAKGGGSYSL